MTGQCYSGTATATYEWDADTPGQFITSGSYYLLAVYQGISPGNPNSRPGSYYYMSMPYANSLPNEFVGSKTQYNDRLSYYLVGTTLTCAPTQIPSEIPSNMPSDIPSQTPSDMPSDIPTLYA